MIIFRFLALAVLLQSGVLLADTTQEIDHLLDFVASSPCQFDRNGTIHNGSEARDHMTMKYEHYRAKVKTAEDFIRYSATKSMMSGKKYKIHCPGTETVDAGDWLLAELRDYRKRQEEQSLAAAPGTPSILEIRLPIGMEFRV